MRLAFIWIAAVLPALPVQADFAAGLEAYHRGDFQTALVEWRPLAEAGVAEAQFNLGLLFRDGKGVDADPVVAHAWFLGAAEQGYARAQYRVASMYENGEGVEPNLILAHMWFALARDQKYEDARKRRKRIAERLSPHELAEAEMLARRQRRRGKGATAD